MKTFAQAAATQVGAASNVGRTTNGAATNLTTHSACLDFFSQAPAMRGKFPQARILFDAAYAENRDVALRTLQWLRDIRGGAGERQLFRDLLTHLCTVDPNDAAIARTIVALGDSLGLVVIAEGVENLRQMEVLHRLGCEVSDLGIVPDRREATLAALSAAAESHDLIVTSGGVSVGEEDHLKPAAQAEGTLENWQIAVKPGKPRSRNYIVDPKESLQVLMRRLRDTLKIKETEAVFLMWGACMEPMAKTVGDIYSERKHPTGILIADLCIEQAFGAF